MPNIKNLQDFLDAYSKEYPPLAIDAILRDFDTDAKYDILMQVKSKLNLLKEEEDIYQGFINHLKEEELARGNILEVGSGFYPILAERLSKIKGTRVTAIDPNLVTTHIPGLKLIRRKFPDAVNVENYDSVVAMMPCDATISIIRESNKRHIPFSIMLCQCTHFPHPALFEPIYYEKWENYVFECIERTRQSDSILSEKQLPDSYQLPFKIITMKYKNK